jgi:hypothetical protein
MKTLVFCTSYSENLAYWEDRWGRWLSFIRGSGLQLDKIIIVDDGSPVLPSWPDVEIIGAAALRPTSGVADIHHFSDRRGRNVNGEPFPGWYRSFGHAVQFAINTGFDRIIHIESDAFLLTQRAIDFFNSCDRGWVSLWCRSYHWPETTLQIINEDRFAACIEFFTKPYSSYLSPPVQPMEKLIPFTHINKTLIGDRYGERSDVVPFGADYVSQIRWGQPASYYWWMREDGMRTSTASDRPNAASLVDKYAIDVSGEFSHNGVDYSEFLRFLDLRLCPAAYLEIGTHQGHSVAQVSCDAICIDPKFVVERNVVRERSRLFLFQMTSDDFFADHDPRTFIGDVDLTFLDGLHIFEALLKDFINFERHSHSGSMVLIHDCLPLNTRMAGRVQNSGPESENAGTRSFWTGDVWRILLILREFRPDLEILLLDCPPTGLVLCSGLDSRSSVLTYAYERIVDRFASISLEDYGIETLWRSFPMLSSRKIIAAPRMFCERFRFRRCRRRRSRATFGPTTRRATGEPSQCALAAARGSVGSAEERNSMAEFDPDNLDDMGILANTDKSSVGGWDYLRHYEDQLAKFRQHDMNVLEIGVFRGASLRLWEKYFPQATVIGIDINPESAKHSGGRKIVEVGSQVDATFLRAVTTKYPPTIIIDDGSHVADHVQFSFEAMFPALLPGGCYVIEDIAFHPEGSGYRGTSSLDTPGYVERIVTLTNVPRSTLGMSRSFQAALQMIDKVTLIPFGAFIWKKPDVDLLALIRAKEALVEQSDTVENWRGLTKFMLARNGSPTHAVAVANRAIAKDPTDHEIYFLLGIALERGGDIPGAISATNEAVRLHAGPSSLYQSRLETLSKVAAGPS